MLPTDMKMAQAVMRCLMDYMQTKISTEADRKNRASTEYPPATMRDPMKGSLPSHRCRLRSNWRHAAIGMRWYLNILVDEIVVQDKTATIKGSYSALAETMQQIKMGNLNQVPTFNPDWCARRDSNS